MEIVGAILHHIEKNRQIDAVLRLRPDELEIEPALQKFFQDVGESYKVTAARGYGVFDDDRDTYPFASYLDRYLSGHDTLTEFSGKSMRLLEREMNGSPLATGGYVVFVHYRDDAQQDFVMVLLLKLKPGTGVDEQTLTLNAILNLDIERLHEAARINVAQWRANNGSYLSFVKRGAGRKNFVEYFRNFLGCSEFIESKGQTLELVRAVRGFCRDNGLDEGQTRAVSEAVFGYCVERRREQGSVTLGALSMRINEADPAAFVRYLDEKNIALGDGFEPHRETFKLLHRVGGQDKDLSISFERALLGTRVRFNRNDESLTIMNLPPALLADLKQN